MPLFRDLPGVAADPSAVGASQEIWLSEAGHLTQFGCFIHVLPPGSATSLKHWHQEEDELVYLLDGTLTLIEGDAEIAMQKGDCATFKAGDPVGHCLRNDGPAEARLLVVGTCKPAECITYPDHDVILTYDDDKGTKEFRDFAGNPTISAYLK